MRRVWTVLLLAGRKYLSIDGSQRAAALAFNALFAMFPIIILVVSAASAFVDRAAAGEALIAYFRNYVPINDEIKDRILRSFFGFFEVRRRAGAAASILLVWAALQFFSNLIRSTNRAWGIDAWTWWHLPLKSLLLLCIMSGAVLAGIVFPILMEMTERWILPLRGFLSRAYDTGSFFIPPLFVFASLLLFYKIAPRGRTRFSDVWIPALMTTALFRAGDALFFVYLRNFTPLNPVYGAFGGAAALLLWSYLSGCVFIYGACLCAAGSEGGADSDRQPEFEKPLVLGKFKRKL